MPSADPEELANRRRARDDPLRLMERRAIEAEEQVENLERTVRRKMNEINNLERLVKEKQQEIRRQQLRAAVLSAALEQKAGAVQPLLGRAAKRSREADIVRALMQSRVKYEDMADVCALVLRFGGPGRESLLNDLEDSPSFASYLKEIRFQRDLETADHLQRTVFSAVKWDLLRFAFPLSWRDINIGRIAFKFDHNARDKSGKLLGRQRQMMMTDSTVPAPELFPAGEMKALEQRKLDGAPVNEQHEDHRGAEVSDVDWWIEKAIVHAKTSKQGGLTTEGRSLTDRIWVILTFDGAGCTDAETAVRLAVFVASCKRLNQSPNNIFNLVAYKEKERAEDVLTLKVRFANVRPQLCRIYSTGQLAPGGKPNGRFVWLGFTGDKPSLCHGLSRGPFSCDAAFSPHCLCPGHDIFKLDHEYASHYGAITFEQRVAWAHVPLHEALGQPEPEGEWWVDCCCCKRVSDASGGLHQIFLTKSPSHLYLISP